MADQNLRIRLVAVTADFSRGMSAASTKLTAFGQKAKAIGSSLKSISLPLAIAGGAAVKLATDFDKSMTQIKSLVGVAGDEVDAMGEQAKKMASDTGTSANEAAEALFYITSAGLRGEEAMQVLSASLKAAAVGLGDTKTVADLATSAMNAYGSNVLSATDATDVMVSAVREGKLEASELAGSMGRVLPIASAMGIGFEEVGAAFAALSRTGTNAAEAATQIRGIFTSLLKPTSDAELALSEMGLSSAELRRQLKEEGLLATLETLKRNFEGNDMAAQRVFGNVRALSGIMDLLGANASTTQQIFANMTGSLGATDQAFEKLSESAEFKLRKAINETKNSFMETGQVVLNALLPHLQELAETITNLFKRFKSLDEDTQKSIITFGEILIIAPLVVSAVGTISTALGGLGQVITYLNGSTMLPRLASLLTAVSAVGALPLLFSGDEAKRGEQALIDAQLALNAEDGFEDYSKGVDELISSDKQLQNATASNQRNFIALNAAIKSTADSFHNFGDVDLPDLDNSLEAANDMASAVDTMLAADGNLQYALATQEASIESFNGTMSTMSNMFVQAGTEGEQASEKLMTTSQRIHEAFQNIQFSAQNAFMAIGQGLTQAFEAMMNGENILKTLGKFLGDMIKRLIAAAMAAAILTSLLGGGAGFNNGTFKGMFAAFSGFGQTKAFANGGIVSSPTLGLVGEYAGARSNPEVIAPLDRLKSLIGDRSGGNVNVSGQFRLDGQDLVVALERANKQRNNFV